jgi:hypothetical protein
MGKRLGQEAVRIDKGVSPCRYVSRNLLHYISRSLLDKVPRLRNEPRARARGLQRFSESGASIHQVVVFAHWTNLDSSFFRTDGK